LTHVCTQEWQHPEPRDLLVSSRTCGRILALSRKLYDLPKLEPVPGEPTPMPFKAARRHQHWSADIRYLDHRLGDFKVYSITILDHYSRRYRRAVPAGPGCAVLSRRSAGSEATDQRGDKRVDHLTL
jgi:hypothetical protein